MKRESTLLALSIAIGFSACSKAKFGTAEDGSFNAAGARVLSVDQDIAVNSDDQVDILFVVDNSSSMAQEQTNFGAKINGFMNLVKDLDWHVALTTTDARVSTKDANGVARAWGDGQFRPFDSDTGSLFVLKAGEISLADAQADLSKAIQVGIKGSGDERAVNSSYRAIERIKETAANADFFRPKARLAIIAISDENECSDGTCLSTKPTSVPSNLVSLVKSSFSADKVFTFNSIARMSTDTCKTATIASVYEDLSKLTDGITGSVCATDYTASLAKLGARVVDLVSSVQLNCVPEDMDGDGIGDVSVVDDNGQIVATPSKVSGRLVTFASALPDGVQHFQYHCLSSYSPN